MVKNHGIIRLSHHKNSYLVGSSIILLNLEANFGVLKVDAGYMVLHFVHFSFFYSEKMKTAGGDK